MTKRTDPTRCRHCHKELTDEQQRGRNQYCGLRCSYDHRPIIQQERRDAEEAKARQDAHDLHAWMRRRNERKAARARARALQAAL